MLERRLRGGFGVEVGDDLLGRPAARCAGTRGRAMLTSARIRVIVPSITVCRKCSISSAPAVPTSTPVVTPELKKQTLEESHVTLSPAGIRLNPVVKRYAWSSELDLIARLAGLRLKERWSGWEREPFNSGGSLHVSVYAR